MHNTFCNSEQIRWGLGRLRFQFAPDRILKPVFNIWFNKALTTSYTLRSSELIQFVYVIVNSMLITRKKNISYLVCSIYFYAMAAH